jgi:peptide/nickel transport system substrate-binding protein
MKLFDRSAITKVQATIIAIIIIVAAVAAGVYIVTRPPTKTTTTTTAAVRLVRRGESMPCYIDPAIGEDFCSEDAHTNLYDPLVWPAPGGGVIPWIATNWTISNDGLTYTFSIQKGVQFHDGGNLTAWDVAFSMIRLLTIGQGYSWIFAPYINITNGITVLDPYTIQFNLNMPEGAFVDSLVRLYIVENATVMAHIVTPGPYGSYGDFGTAWLSTNEAGSGPYELTAISVDSYVDMKQFAGYWNPSSFNPLAPTEVDLVATAAETATEKTLMLDKQLEVSDEWQSDAFLDPLNITGYTSIQSQADDGEYYYMMNCQKPPTDDVYLRMALEYCFPYQTVLTNIYDIYAPAESCIPMSLPGAIDCNPYYYNLTMAKECLALSKYADNISDYDITFQVMNEVPIRMDDALLFAAQCALVGITVTVTSVPWGTMMGELTNNATAPNIVPIVVDPLFADAGAMLYERYSIATQNSFNNCVWLNNATLDAEMDAANANMNTTSRMAQLAQIQEEIMNLAPDIWVYDFKVVEVVQNYVSIPTMQNPSLVTGIQGYNDDFKTWAVNETLAAL